MTRFSQDLQLEDGLTVPRFMFICNTSSMGLGRQEGFNVVRNEKYYCMTGLLLALLCLIPAVELRAGDAVKFKVKNADGFPITYEVREGTSGLVSVTDAKVKKKAVLRIPETVEYAGKSYTVVEIADRAFATNKEHGLPFSAVELPATICRIGKCAFQQCDRMESINLPEGLLIIDACAFSSTFKLQQFGIPSSVIYIGGKAFQNMYINILTFSDKECELTNLPAIVTPDNCEQYGLKAEGVVRYYATHEAPEPLVDVNSEEIQRLIAVWNAASDAKWNKRAQRAKVMGTIAAGLLGAATVAVPVLTNSTNSTSSAATTTSSLQSGISNAVSQSSATATKSITTRSDADGGSSTSENTSGKAKKHHFCRFCSGTGKCSYCNGDGWYTSLGTGRKADVHCPVCKNHNGKCNHCNGRGEWYD